MRLSNRIVIEILIWARRRHVEFSKKNWNNYFCEYESIIFFYFRSKFKEFSMIKSRVQGINCSKKILSKCLLIRELLVLTVHNFVSHFGLQIINYLPLIKFDWHYFFFIRIETFNRWFAPLTYRITPNSNVSFLTDNN